MPAKKPTPVKNIAFWVAAGAIIIVLWSLLQTPSLIKSEVTFSQFLNDAEAQKLQNVTITGSEIKGVYKDGTAFKTVLPQQFNDLVKILLKKVMPLIDIEAVLLDRGFYAVAVICDIIELGLVFEMPAPRNEKVKGYLADTGLICHSLALSSPKMLTSHPQWGAIFETFVVNEIRKQELGK
jgi:ATP-dependent Zn protease